ncbi:MAG: hypothetical protein H5T74_03705 [Actinobacteria bacterium]|nr:hypothetical protein [Actinomycetota bacterium]
MPASSFLRMAASICAGIALAALAAGCGSAPLDDYQRRVGEINRTSAELLAEAAHLAEEGGLPAHEDAGEGAPSPEELVEELRAAALELSRVKVPAGMEDFHADLLALYAGTSSALEGLLSSREHGAEEEGSVHGGEPSPDEESSHGEGEAREEESTAGHGEQGETGGEPHSGTGH